jgi:hypothetical protein
MTQTTEVSTLYSGKTEISEKSRVITVVWFDSLF